MLESDKDALKLSVAITEGEKRDIERKVSELEEQKVTADKRAEEIEIQNNSLVEQLKVAKEKKFDITPICIQLD